MFKNKLKAIFLAMLITLPTATIAEDLVDFYAVAAESLVQIRTTAINFDSGFPAQVPGCGSGFFYQKDKILTAAHLVADVDVIMLKKHLGKDTVSAEIVAINSEHDIAMLQVKSKDNVPATINRKDDVAIGTYVALLGYPGCKFSFTTGHVSNVLVSNGKKIETNAVANPGSSGGPLYNINTGAVIGLSHTIDSYKNSKGFIGKSTFINLKESIAELENSSSYIGGFTAIKLSKYEANMINLPGEGLLVQKVLGGAARQLGLKASHSKITLNKKQIKIGGDFILTGLDAATVARKMLGDDHFEMRVLNDGVERIVAKPAFFINPR